MATPAKPLTASIAERLGLPKPEPEKRPAPRIGPTPPPPAKLHQLPPPEGPDRSLVEPTEVAGQKKKLSRVQYTDKFKADVVARVIAAQTEGKHKEPIAKIAKEVGVHPSNISNWLKAKKKRKKARIAPKGAKFWADALAKAAEAQARGETQRSVAAALGVSETALSWQKAKAERSRATGKAPGSAPPARAAAGKEDIGSVSRELAEAMGRVAELKQRLVRLLGE